MAQSGSRGPPRWSTRRSGSGSTRSRPVRSATRRCPPHSVPKPPSPTRLPTRSSANRTHCVRRPGPRRSPMRSSSWPATGPASPPVRSWSLTAASRRNDEQMNARSIEDLLDREQIRDLLARYPMAFDDRDWAAWEELWTEDVVWVVDGAPIEGLDAVREFMTNCLPDEYGSKHLCGSPVIELADDRLSASALT